MTSTLCFDITRTDHAAVESFIERIAAFGFDDWKSVAAACGDRTTEMAASLDPIVALYGLGVDAWSIADDVETAVHCSLGSQGFTASRDGAAIRLARKAATVGALALLLRPVVPASEFERLYKPFASLVPLPPEAPRLPSPVPRDLQVTARRSRLA